MLDRDRELLQAGDLERISARAEILQSWQRCRLNGVDPDRLNLRYRPPVAESRLKRAALPLLHTLAETMVGSGTSLLLTDRDGRLIWRWSENTDLGRTLDRRQVVTGTYWDELAVGTGGVGTSLETAQPQTVTGAEHYVEDLHDLACVGVPIRHTITNRVEGVLNMTSLAVDAHPLMQPTLVRIAGEVETALFGDSSKQDRALFRRFLKERQRSRSAVVVMNDEIFLANRAAAALGLDHRATWQRAERVLDGRGEALLIDDDGRTVRLHQVSDRGTTIGAVMIVESRDPQPGRSAAVAHRPRLATPAVAPRFTALVEAGRRAAGESVRLLVGGEPGVGKLTLLRAVVGDDVRVVDGASPDWPVSAASALSSDAGWTVLTHLDLVEETQCLRLAALLDRARTHFAGTWTGPLTNLSGHRQAVLDRFDADVLEIPPLRQRPDDIADVLAELPRSNPPVRLTAAAEEILVRHPWPGNVRQLRSVVSWVRGRGKPAIGADDLPRHIGQEVLRRRLTPLEAAEAEVIRGVLRDCQGNKVLAAERLGIARSSLYRKIRDYRLDVVVEEPG